MRCLLIPSGGYSKFSASVVLPSEGGSHEF
jgi:hypothetical protein